jgi:ribulose-phosphate 3-epimerase
MIEIIPAIMPTSFEDLSDKVSFVANHADMVQLDIMDGKFVKARSWPYFSNDSHSFESLLAESEGMPYWDKINYEIDLMISNPEDSIDNWITAGASRIVVHVESTKQLDEIVHKMHGRFGYNMNRAPDVELGIALNIDTPTDVVLPFLEQIQFVQFMGINTIGLQGEPFDERVIDKIHAFHNAHPEIIISVDGGVNFENARILTEIGVKRLVSGSTIFGSTNIPATLEDFKNLAN